MTIKRLFNDYLMTVKRLFDDCLGVFSLSLSLSPAQSSPDFLFSLSFTNSLWLSLFHRLALAISLFSAISLSLSVPPSLSLSLFHHLSLCSSAIPLSFPPSLCSPSHEHSLSVSFTLCSPPH